MLIYSRVSQIESILEELDASLLREAEVVEEVYPFRCTDYYANLVMQPSLEDPIFAQIFPSIKELEGSGEEDPFGEEESTGVDGLVRRYRDRLLVISTNVCFVHCRFCMRKRNWKKSPFVFENFSGFYRYLMKHPEIEDVIISGGDPFTLSNDAFEELLRIARKVPSVKIIRIGTRAPVVAPGAIYEKLGILERYAPVWINTHFNHPREITPDAAKAIEALIKAGCPVNNQSVLLKGVNDSFEVLARLFKGLLSIGVRPYYLFSCDPVKGTHHFFVPLERALSIVAKLREKLSGMAVPHFAVDGKDGKKILP